LDLRSRLCLLGSPTLRVLSIPTGTLDRVLKLGSLATDLAHTDADRAIRALNLPVVLAL